MRIIHLIALIIVALSLFNVSNQYNTNVFIVYGVWVSGFLIGSGFDEALKKFNTRTKNSNY